MQRRKFLAASLGSVAAAMGSGCASAPIQRSGQLFTG
jgi:hypothetical protein